jgi:hypothetical protein
MAKKSRNRSKPARNVVRKVARGAKAAKPAPRVSLAALSTEALAAELKRRRSELPKLEKQAAKLRAELAAVLARMASLGGEVPAAGHAPAKPAAVKSGSLKGAPRRTLNGKPTIGEQIAGILGESGTVMSPRDIAGVLGKRLSREVNTNFLVQISLTLARLVKQGRVNKVGRGQYSAGSGAAVAAND